MEFDFGYLFLYSYLQIVQMGAFIMKLWPNNEFAGVAL